MYTVVKSTAILGIEFLRRPSETRNNSANVVWHSRKPSLHISWVDLGVVTRGGSRPPFSLEFCIIF